MSTSSWLDTLCLSKGLTTTLHDQPPPDDPDHHSGDHDNDDQKEEEKERSTFDVLNHVLDELFIMGHHSSRCNRSRVQENRKGRKQAKPTKAVLLCGVKGVVDVDHEERRNLELNVSKRIPGRNEQCENGQEGEERWSLEGYHGERRNLELNVQCESGQEGEKKKKFWGEGKLKTRNDRVSRSIGVSEDGSGVKKVFKEVEIVDDEEERMRNVQGDEERRKLLGKVKLKPWNERVSRSIGRPQGEECVVSEGSGGVKKVFKEVEVVDVDVDDDEEEEGMRNVQVDEERGKLRRHRSEIGVDEEVGVGVKEVFMEVFLDDDDEEEEEWINREEVESNALRVSRSVGRQKNVKGRSKQFVNKEGGDEEGEKKDKEVIEEESRRTKHKGEVELRRLRVSSSKGRPRNELRVMSEAGGVNEAVEIEKEECRESMLRKQVKFKELFGGSSLGRHRNELCQVGVDEGVKEVEDCRGSTLRKPKEQVKSKVLGSSSVGKHQSELYLIKKVGVKEGKKQKLRKPVKFNMVSDVGNANDEEVTDEEIEEDECRKRKPWEKVKLQPLAVSNLRKRSRSTLRKEQSLVSENDLVEEEEETETDKDFEVDRFRKRKPWEQVKLKMLGVSSMGRLQDSKPRKEHCVMEEVDIEVEERWGVSSRNRRRQVKFKPFGSSSLEKPQRSKDRNEMNLVYEADDEEDIEEEEWRQRKCRRKVKLKHLGISEPRDELRVHEEIGAKEVVNEAKKRKLRKQVKFKPLRGKSWSELYVRNEVGSGDIEEIEEEYRESPLRKPRKQVKLKSNMRIPQKSKPRSELSLQISKKGFYNNEEVELEEDVHMIVEEEEDESDKSPVRERNKQRKGHVNNVDLIIKTQNRGNKNSKPLRLLGSSSKPRNESIVIEEVGVEEADNDVRKEQCGMRMRKRNVDNGNNIEVTIIDTSVKGWKMDMVIHRKGEVWKVREEEVVKRQLTWGRDKKRKSNIIGEESVKKKKKKRKLLLVSNGKSAMKEVGQEEDLVLLSEDSTHDTREVNKSNRGLLGKILNKS